jgi:hypothetical protein
VLLGGLLTDSLDWHWIFLVNLPIASPSCSSRRACYPAPGEHRAAGRLDVGGAVVVTSALMLAVYAVVNGNQDGSASGRTLGLFFAAAGLALFARAPLDGTFLVDVLPGMVLLGLGAGIAFNPVLMAAMSDVAPEKSASRRGSSTRRS